MLTLENILNYQITLSDDYQQRNVSPCEQTELLHVVFLNERQHEPNESNAVQAERQESVISDEESQCFHSVKQDSEVIEKIFSVEEVI
jgi:hypothetical protein